jgi:nitric oxide reductase NorD protein
VPVATIAESDPLRRDLLRLRRSRDTVDAILSRFPGLARPYAKLAAATAMARPRRPLPRTEREVEQIVLALLDAGRPPEGTLWSAMIGTSALPARAPAGYRPVLPCPLWGDCWKRDITPARVDDDERSQNPQPATPDTRERFAVRERDDDASQRDPFVLNRFEKILAMAEMVNVDRPADDSEDEDARKAADDLEELAIGRRIGKPATKLKFDLDLPPEAVDAARLEAGRLYPEWDYRSGAHLPDHCRVLATDASETGETWAPDETMRRHIRQVRRRFEALRPRRR